MQGVVEPERVRDHVGPTLTVQSFNLLQSCISKSLLCRSGCSPPGSHMETHSRTACRLWSTLRSHRDDDHIYFLLLKKQVWATYPDPPQALDIAQDIHITHMLLHTATHDLVAHTSQPVRSRDPFTVP